jgi:hypothetical protein
MEHLMEPAKVNGIELAYEVVGRVSRCCSSTARTSPTRCSHSWPNRRWSASSASATSGEGSVGAPARSTRGRPALPSRPTTPSGSSTTSGSIAPTWWATPWVARSPWSSRPSTPPGWRRWCSWNRCCSPRPPGRPSRGHWRPSSTATKPATPRPPCTASWPSRVTATGTRRSTRPCRAGSRRPSRTPRPSARQRCLESRPGPSAGAGGGHHLPRAVGPRQQQQPPVRRGPPAAPRLVPACQDANIVGATHLLQMQAPGPVATATAAFL